MRRLLNCQAKTVFRAGHDDEGVFPKRFGDDLVNGTSALAYPLQIHRAGEIDLAGQN